MAASEWTWTAMGGGTSQQADAAVRGDEREGATTPWSWADWKPTVESLVNDRPALAVGIAFVVGVTLGWIIKR